MNNNDVATIDVAAGVLFDEQHRVLITQRPAGKHESGWWEFPGGKIHATESPLQALERELQEELGIGVEKASALLNYTHAYPDRRVNLHVWLVEEISGRPAGIEGQALQWVAISDLMKAGLLPADLRVVEKLQQMANSKSTL